MLAIDSALIEVAGFFNQEWAADKDLAASAASCALALPSGEQFVVPGGVNIRAKKTAKFSGNLAGAQTKLAGIEFLELCGQSCLLHWRLGFYGSD